MGFTYQQDYILRLIQRMAQLLARLMRLKEDRQFEQARATLEEAWTDLLGPERQWLREVDTGTVCAMLQEPDLIKAFARLVREEGEIRQLEGDPWGAQARYMRALELYLEARLLVPRDTECAEAIEALRKELDPSALAGAYRTVLNQED